MSNFFFLENNSSFFESILFKYVCAYDKYNAFFTKIKKNTHTYKNGMGGYTNILENNNVFSFKNVLQANSVSHLLNSKGVLGTGKLLFSFSIGICLIKPISIGFNNIVYSFNKETDQNVGSTEDHLLLFGFILFFTIFQFFSLKSSVQVFEYVHLFFFTYFTLLIITPLTILFSYGSFVFFFLKGSLSGKNILSSPFYDLIAKGVFLIRYILQSVRLVIIIYALFLLHEFFFEVNYNLLLKNTFFYTYEGTTGFFFLKITTILLKFFYEIVDFFFNLVMQTIAFTLVVFWLFNFLFYTTTSLFYENYLTC